MGKRYLQTHGVINSFSLQPENTSLVINTFLCPYKKFNTERVEHFITHKLCIPRYLINHYGESVFFCRGEVENGKRARKVKDWIRKKDVNPQIINKFDEDGR